MQKVHFFPSTFAHVTPQKYLFTFTVRFINFQNLDIITMSNFQKIIKRTVKGDTIFFEVSHVQKK